MIKVIANILNLHLIMSYAKQLSTNKIRVKILAQGKNDS
jgi:hypothetical protein